MTILFVNYPQELPPESVVKEWINYVVLNHNKQIELITIQFVSVEEIKEIHYYYFNDGSETDVITLNYNNDKISGELFICSEFVEKNIINYATSSLQGALLRVIIHGVLHLLGYDDLTPQERDIMIQQEDNALNIFYSQFV